MIVLIIAYIIIASIAVFFLVLLTLAHNHRDRYYDIDLVVPVLSGVLWPIGAPIYTGYILAKLYADRLTRGDGE